MIKDILSNLTSLAASSKLKDNVTIANEVLEGKWGSGDTRKQKLIKAGYNYDLIQKEVANLLKENGSRAAVIANMEAWAVKISNDNRYSYKKWAKDIKTHQCPICHPELMKDGADGWNCIGFAFAIWHHGGRLKSKCNCGVISNEVGEKIYKAKTDAEALKIVREHVGINEITVIRNNKKVISKSKVKPGDICLLFDGDVYKHTFFIMSNNKVADSTGSGSKANNIRADRDFSGRYVNGLKVIIRYTGNGNAAYYKSITQIKSKTVDELAHEVLQGKWGSGDERKKKLTKAGYNYNAVQKRVNELVNVKKLYSSQLPTMKLVKTNAEVIADTIKWLKWIVSDNDFHYGYTSPDKKANAHHNGCYFCKTQYMKKNMLMPEHTYCCNALIGAAWAHGGCVPTALKMCQHTKSWGFSKSDGYNQSVLFTNLGHPDKSKLKPGDVLCKDTHVALYIGNGKLIEAAGGDDNKKYSTKWNNSIHVAVLTDARYKGFPRVHRFNGSVNTTMYIRHGEVSKRVAQWQAFLDWYFDGKVGKADGCYGDNTLKWTKKFQEEQIGKGQGDGIIGPKTLEAAKNCKK